MKDFLKVSVAAIGGTFVILIVLSIFGVGGGLLNLELTRFFGTRMESIKTDIYRENKSYVEGTVRDLREMRVEYEKAGEGHRDALRSLILQRARELDYGRLPSDVRDFLTQLEAR